MISTQAFGLRKFAVPTCTAAAPTSRNSRASPRSGSPRSDHRDLHRLHASHTIRSATGFTAGPERPPVTLERMDGASAVHRHPHDGV